MSTFNQALYELSGKDIFLFCDIDNLDFTKNKPSKLIISSAHMSIELRLDSAIEKLQEQLAYVQAMLGGDNVLIMTWNLKNFISFVKGKTGCDFKINGNIFDISLLESYSGIKDEKPIKFSEAKLRLGKLIKKTNWDNIYKYYKAVFLPLTFTLPHLETFALSHKAKKIKVYSHYEIDGQSNGRMKTLCNQFKNYYNPHSLGPDERENLRAPGWDYQFISFDYKHMEVSVLGWLTQDDYMTSIFDSDRDLYESIWEALIPIECNEQHRKTCKQFFLPVIYGLGSDGLADKIKWPLVHAKNLIEKINKTFPVAMNWIKQKQNSSIDGCAFDHFGRARFFDSNYKIRNFVIQSPSSLICLDKLNQLCVGLKNLAHVVMHIHDGYVLLAKKDHIAKTIKTAKNILEQESDLYPGLKLKTICSVGSTLNDLKNYDNNLE